jgi:serine phosphatase RsbU (regulator of sigma subunit)
LEENEIEGPSILFAACDCTGHGVPGAMVSVVCSTALNKAVKEFKINEPSKILDKVAELVIEDLSKNNEDNDEIKDGMDASLANLNLTTLQLEWAGANNPLWIVRGAEIIEIKANKQPIGKTDYLEPFTNHHIQLQKGDTIYLFTDGYADQFGGEKGKKYSKIKFKELLLSIQHLNMSEQREALYNAHMQWCGNNEQVDDICVIGVRV